MAFNFPSVQTDGPVEHPADVDGLGLLLGCAVVGPLLRPADLARQPAHVVLRAPPLSGQPPELRHLPPAHEVLHHVGVVRRRVHPRALRRRREVIEEVVVAAVSHALAGHGDLGSHHGRERPHHTVRVALEGPGDDPCVGDLVALLVGSDDPTELGEAGVSVEFWGAIYTLEIDREPPYVSTISSNVLATAARASLRVMCF